MLQIPKRKNIIDSYTDQTQFNEVGVSDDDLFLIDETTNKNSNDVMIIETKTNLKSKETNQHLESSDDDFKVTLDLTKNTLRGSNTDQKKTTIIPLTDTTGEKFPKQKKSPIAVVKPYNPSNDQVMCSKYFKKDTSESLEETIEGPVMSISKILIFSGFLQI